MCNAAIYFDGRSLCANNIFCKVYKTEIPVGSSIVEGHLIAVLSDVRRKDAIHADNNPLYNLINKLLIEFLILLRYLKYNKIFDSKIENLLISYVSSIFNICNSHV